MSKYMLTALCLTVVLATVLLAGCPPQGAEVAPNAVTSARPHGATDSAEGAPATGEEKAMPMTGAASGQPATTTAAGDMATCPVSGEKMAKSKMLTAEYQGKTYYFCCKPCLEKFKQNPTKYLKDTAAPAKGGAATSEGGHTKTSATPSSPHRSHHRTTPPVVRSEATHEAQSAHADGEVAEGSQPAPCNTCPG